MSDSEPKDPDKGRNYFVKTNINEGEYYCECCKYEWDEIVCCHIIKAMDVHALHLAKTTNPQTPRCHNTKPPPTPLLSLSPTPHPIAAAATGDGDHDGRHHLRPLSPRGRLLPSAATAIAGAAGCFALGYFLALARLPIHAAAPAPGEDDSEDDSDEDDDENSGRARPAKRAAGRKRTGLRLLFWSRNVVTKSDSAREAERAQAQTASAPLEIENLAKIIEDFKMRMVNYSVDVVAGAVLVVRNDLKMGKGKIAAQCRFQNSHGYSWPADMVDDVTGGLKLL
ncbi:Peptidyl-tRNA hydrolase 2, mitochondrial [Hordeum vulgare]|nr:Peptidyl-tRNA hydrolase 2, mitochondrial [Hordeum vulgare]